MNILCTGGALLREKSLRKKDKGEKQMSINVNCFVAYHTMLRYISRRSERDNSGKVEMGERRERRKLEKYYT